MSILRGKTGLLLAARGGAAVFWTLAVFGMVGFLGSPSTALAGGTATITVPADTTAGTTVTDVKIKGKRADGTNAPMTVTDDGAFTSADTSPLSIVWKLDGAALGPGDSTTITYTGAAVKVEIMSWSWKDAAGKEHHGAELPDPMACVVISGGESGATYLGVFIPAGEWGYFYQVFNEDSDSIEKARFVNRAPYPLTDFVILEQAYPPAVVDEFVSAWDDETQTLSAFDYLSEADATSGGTAPTAWSSEPGYTGAVAEFGTPLGVGETSTLFGFISEAGPDDTLHDVNETAQLYTAGDVPICPEYQAAMVPTREAIPTVSEWGLIVMTLLLLTAGTVVFGRRRRPATA